MNRVSFVAMSDGMQSVAMPVVGTGEKEMAPSRSDRKTRKLKLTVYVPRNVLEDFKNVVYSLYGFRHGVLSKAVTEALILYTEKALNELSGHFNPELNEAVIKAIEEAMKAKAAGGEQE